MEMEAHLPLGAGYLQVFEENRLKAVHPARIRSGLATQGENSLQICEIQELQTPIQLTVNNTGPLTCGLLSVNVFSIPYDFLFSSLLL